jgi:hypothetical protein
LLITVYPFAILESSAAIGKRSFPLVFLDDPDALCLDGSRSGYWLRRPEKPTTQWMLYLGGGAWCWSLENCFYRSSTEFGSSKTWPRRIAAEDFGGGLLSPNCSINPTFCDFNLASINYCDGNSFSSARREPLTYNNKTLYFRGKQILDALLRQLVETEGLGHATAFVLTGGSAGGLAVYLHSDDIYDGFLKLHLPLLKKYAAIPVSGFFLDHANIAYAAHYEKHIRAAFYLTNASSGVSSRCLDSFVRSGEASQSWRCNFASYTFPLTKVPTLALNSKDDFWQLTCILNLMPLANYANATFNNIINGNCSAVPGFECLNWGGYANCSSRQMAPVLRWEGDFMQRIFSIPAFRQVPHGAFISSCFTHCEGQDDRGFTSIVVQGINMSTAVSRWWSAVPKVNCATPDTHSVSPHFYVDCDWRNTTPYRCNPTCTGP